MKGKLHTKKEFENAEQVFTNFGTKYLIDWTQQELKKFRTEPVVIPAGNYGFLVGTYKIIGQSNDCWRVEQLDNTWIHSFISKQNAILFCLLEITNKQKMANELLQLDHKLGNLLNDVKIYKHILDKSKDKQKNAIILSRYTDAKAQCKINYEFLKKTLNSAKYLKFGN